MKYPEYYDSIEKITLYDPLAEFLGSFEKGIIEYSFAEIVKMAGHGCATVAGAYIMTVEGLKKLYPENLPERGNIKVEFPMPQTEGTQGVVGTVVSNITGATSDFGFKGLGGKFDRTNLMFFSAKIDSNVRFTRLDTGKTVDVYYNPSTVMSPENGLQQMSETVKTIFENIDKVIIVK